MIVLYASDPRVTAYSKAVAQKFTDVGADVFVNVRLLATPRRARRSTCRRLRAANAPFPPRPRSRPPPPLLPQLNLTEASGDAGSSIIKPEHLSTVITSSAADFLIVIGDRNMRNDTCQVRC